MRARVVGNISTNEMTDMEAQAYIRGRAAYNYPKAYLQCVPLGEPCDIAVLHANYVPANGHITDLCLDQYHYNLLHSHDNGERRLGLASIIYWGFFTHSDAFARNRVHWHINGRADAQPTTAETVMACTNQASENLLQRNMGDALAAFANVNELGRTPFASKVVAFMAPSVAGVYDNRISNGLIQEPWASYMSRGIGKSNSPTVKKCYSSWCVYLTQIAAQLNMGIAAGYNWHWSCGNDEQQRWRALDVERAIFAMMA